MKKNSEKETNKSISSIESLQKIIDESKKNPYDKGESKKPQYIKNYIPGKNVIVDGMEVSNFENPGFPTFDSITNMLESLIKRGMIPLYVILDESFPYLLNERDYDRFSRVVKEGINLSQRKIEIVLTKNPDDTVKTLVNYALEYNTKIVTNQDVLHSYEILTQEKSPAQFKRQLWQIKYTIVERKIQFIV